MKKESNTQKWAEWINSPLLRKSRIKESFHFERRKENPNQKDFGFWKKINKDHPRQFTDEDFIILAKIKDKVNDSIKSGNFTYVFDKAFIELYLIPALKGINKLSYSDTPKSLHLSTITTCYNKPKHSKFIAMGVVIAMKNYKKIQL